MTTKTIMPYFCVSRSELEDLKERLLWLKEMKSHLDDEVSRTDKTTEYTFESLGLIAEMMGIASARFAALRECNDRMYSQRFEVLETRWQERRFRLDELQRSLMTDMNRMLAVYGMCISSLKSEIDFLERWTPTENFSE